MKKLVLLITSFAIVLSGSAAPSVIRKSGECKIASAKSDGDEGTVRVALKNSAVEILCKFRVDDFFGLDVVLAKPEIKNLTREQLDLAYHVAFFSKDGELIGSATQKGKVDANGTVEFSSCSSKIPPAEIAQISAYKICVYVNEAKPKK